MANCDDIQIELSAYLDGEASPAERAAVEAHVQSCPACRTLLDELTFAQGSLAALPKLKAPASLAAAIRQERAKPEAPTAEPQIVSFEPKRATASWRPALMGIAAMLMAGVLIFLLLPLISSSPTSRTAMQDEMRPARSTAPVADVAGDRNKNAGAPNIASIPKAADAPTAAEAEPSAPAAPSAPPSIMPVLPATPPPPAQITAGARKEAMGKEAMEGKMDRIAPRAEKDLADEKSERDSKQLDRPAYNIPPPTPRDAADKVAADERRNELLAQQHTAPAKPGSVRQADDPGAPAVTLGAPKSPAAAPAPSPAADGSRRANEEAAKEANENWKDRAVAKTKQKEAAEPLKPPQEQLGKQQDAQASNANGVGLAGGNKFGTDSANAISGKTAQNEDKAERVDRFQNAQANQARKTPQADDDVAVREKGKAEDDKTIARATTKTLAPAATPAPATSLTSGAAAPRAPGTPNTSAAKPAAPADQPPAKSQASSDLTEQKALSDRGVSADAEGPRNASPGGAYTTRQVRAAVPDQRRIVCRKDELDGVLTELQKVAQQSGGSLAAPSTLALERGQGQGAAKGSEMKKSVAEDGLKKDTKNADQAAEQERQDKAAALQPARSGRILTYTLTVSARQKQAVLDKLGDLSPAFNKRNATRVAGDKLPAKDGGAGGGPGGQTSSGGGGDEGGPGDLDAGGNVMNQAQPDPKPAANGFVENDAKSGGQAKKLDAAKPEPPLTRDDLVTITIEIETLP